MSAAIPSRMSAWSSTVSTRIGLVLVTILGLLPIGCPNLLSQEPESAAGLRSTISNGGRDGQRDFGSGSMLAPYFQLTAKALFPLAHPRKSPVSGASAAIGNIGSNSDAVVPHVQQKLRIAVGNSRFDLLSLGVP